MRCIHFRIRSKDYKKSFHCVREKYNTKKIELNECNNCPHKIYKFVKPLRQSTKPMKNRSSKLSKACDIPKSVREIVEARDKGICVICKINKGIPNMHYVARSQLGLGIEENVVCGCVKCHHEYDNTPLREHHKEIIKAHLQNKYENWDESKLIYCKY